MEKSSKLYLENGLTVMNSVINAEYIANLRQEIIDVINEASEKNLDYDGTKESFVKETTRSLWKIVNDDPNKSTNVYAMGKTLLSMLSPRYQFS